MTEKKCKHCAMMIPEEAKICPHCRKAQPSKASKWLILFIVVIFGYTCSKMPSSTSDNPTNIDAPQNTPQAQVTLTTKGQKVKAKYPGWSNDDCNTIAEKKIHVGMTSDQVKAAWGKPYKINSTTGAYGTHEQWVMHDSMNSDYVYFENGVMTSVQQSQ